MSLLLVSGLSCHLKCPSLCAPIGWPPPGLLGQVGGMGLPPGPCHQKCPVEQLEGNVLAPKASGRHRPGCQRAPCGVPPRLSLQDPSLLHSPPLPPSAGALEGPFSLPRPVSRSPSLHFKQAWRWLDFSLGEKAWGCGGGWFACPSRNMDNKGPEPPVGCGPPVLGWPLQMLPTNCHQRADALHLDF